MSELSMALHRFADSIDSTFPDATQCALVLGDSAAKVSATYIGRAQPANAAGICLLASGIQSMATKSVKDQMTFGSTH